jgi:hypothetical protein
LKAAYPIVLGHAARTCDEREVFARAVFFEEQRHIAVNEETAGAATAPPTRWAEKVFEDEHGRQ